MITKEEIAVLIAKLATEQRKVSLEVYDGSEAELRRAEEFMREMDYESEGIVSQAINIQ